MMTVKQLRLLVGACLISCVTADAGDDFSNNLFSDLAPLLALFGERVTMQFMSQAMGWADNIILAMAPLGIVTAIVGAIRVGGPSWLKTIIGRARESRAISEAELMSSTSSEVCELWNGHEIVRVMGQGPIREFIIVSPTKEDKQKNVTPTQQSTATSIPNQSPTLNPDPAGLANGTTADPTRQQIQQVFVKPWGTGTEYYLEEENARAKESTVNRPIPNGFRVRNGQSQRRQDIEGGQKGGIEMGTLSNNNSGQAENHTPSAVLRITGKGVVPNLTLNSHDHVDRRELHVVAACGIVIQLGVLVYFGIAAKYFKHRLLKDDKPVADYAFPCAVVGTLLLVFGMLTCAHIVESSTVEERYHPAPGKEVQIVWLQKAGTVNDQVFQSFAIYPEHKQKLLTTSRRADSQMLRKSAPAKFSTRRLFGQQVSPQSLEQEPENTEGRWRFEQALTVIGTIVSLLGFILQFIGLRGMNWSASIAQLGAIGVMVVLKTIVRRKLAQVPRSVSLTPEHELDWLAVKIANKPSEASSSLSSKCTSSDNDEWDWRSVRLQAFEVASEKTARQGFTKRPSKANSLIKLRRDLGSLADWKSPASTEAICLARAIEIAMDTLFASYDMKSFDWPLRVNDGTINFRLERRQGKSWHAFADELDAALSLWLFSVYEREHDRKSDEKDSNTHWNEGKEEADDDSWLREKGTIPKRSLRLLGPLSPALDRDLGWWMLDSKTRVIKVEQDMDWWVSNSKTKVVKVEEDAATKNERQLFVETHRIVGFMPNPKVLDLTGHGKALSATSSEPPSNKDLLRILPFSKIGDEFERNDELTPSDEDGSPNVVHKSQTSTTLLATESFTSLNVLFAQHMFSAFMWAAAKELKHPVPGKVEVRPTGADSDDQDSAWKSFALHNAELSKLVQDIQTTGLGTLEDIWFSVVPPLSSKNMLPRADTIVQWTRQHARPYEKLGHWWEARSAYSWLFRISQTFPENDTIRTKATALMLECLRVVDNAVKLGKAQEFERYVIDELVELSSRLFEELKKADNGILRRLISLYKTQRRPWVYPLVSETGLIHSEDAIVQFTQAHEFSLNGDAWNMEELLEKESSAKDRKDIMDWTPLHYAAAAGEADALQELLDVRPDVNAVEIHGLTPLHLACDQGNLNTVQRLIRAGADVGVQDADGRASLHHAAAHGHDDVVKFLVEAGADANLSDGLGNTPLHWAAYKGSSNMVKILWNDTNRKQRDKSGRTPLHLAAMREADGTVVVDVLIDQLHADKEAKDQLGRTPLHLAAGAGHKAIVELLLQERADIEARDSDGRTPLHLAARTGHSAVVELLLEKGADKDVKDNRGKTLLHAAAGEGKKPVVRLVLYHAATVGIPDRRNRTLQSEAVEYGQEAVSARLLLALEAKDERGDTPLMTAANKGHEAVVQLLLERGAALEVKDKYGQTSLHAAATPGHEAVVQLLLDRGAALEVKDKYGKTSLHAAARPGHEAVVQLLLERGAALEAKDEDNRTSLHVAINEGHEAVVQLLLDRGAALEARDRFGRTPIHLAINEGHEAVVQLLLDRGAALEARDQFGRTPIHLAINEGHEAVVQLLLDRGAALEARDQFGRTLIHLATNAGHEAVVQLLLDRGAALEARDRFGRTPIHLATNAGHEAVVQLLLDRGAALEARDGAAKTPLLSAAESGHEGVARLLLERGAALEAKDKDGCTPLHLATKKGSEAVVRLLLNRGAAIDERNESGETSLHFAAFFGRNAVVTLLLQRGAEDVGNNDGQSALDLAIQQKQEGCIRLLEQASR